MAISGFPNDGEDAQFLLVHARPFLLTFEPDALNPWGLDITTNRMPTLDGVSEVVGQVRWRGEERGHRPPPQSFGQGRGENRQVVMEGQTMSSMGSM